MIGSPSLHTNKKHTSPCLLNFNIKSIRVKFEAKTGINLSTLQIKIGGKDRPRFIFVN